MALMRLPFLIWMTSTFDDRLMEFDRYCFSISAHRAFIGSFFIVRAICWFDVRQKQLQSTFWTTSSGNRRQRGRIRTIWLRHGAPPTVTGGSALVSQPPTPAGKALVGDAGIWGPTNRTSQSANVVKTINGVN